MTTEHNTFDRLNEIADLIEPFEAPWFTAFAVMGDPNDGKTGEQQWNELVEATRRLNDAILSHVAEIARVTGNNESTLRQVFCANKEDKVGNINAHFGGNPAWPGWGPSAFLRCVAKYKSFNTHYWDSQGFNFKEFLAQRQNSHTA